MEFLLRRRILNYSNLFVISMQYSKPNIEDVLFTWHSLVVNAGITTSLCSYITSGGKSVNIFHTSESIIIKKFLK